MTVLSTRKIWGRTIIVKHFIMNFGKRNQYDVYKTITLEPREHECVCNRCGHNPLVGCSCGHSCYQFGCVICGNYE